jgi:sigma-B regulation protein RsbU (phosphoserine phosphatase)
MVVRANGSISLLSDGGMVLGIFPDNTYQQGQTDVGPGDRVIFYTDGITEARSADGEEYGEERLVARAVGARELPVERLKEALLADVNGFTGGKFEDDATLIVVGLDGSR